MAPPASEVAPIEDQGKPATPEKPRKLRASERAVLEAGQAKIARRDNAPQPQPQSQPQPQPAPQAHAGVKKRSSLPRVLLFVLIIGLLLGSAAAVGLMYLNRLDDEGGRVLSLRLVPQEEVRDLYEGHKEQIGGDLVKMKAEIQAIMEEAQARQAGSKDA